jgi:hypothetical protein
LSPFLVANLKADTFGQMAKFARKFNSDAHFPVKGQRRPARARTRLPSY